MRFIRSMADGLSNVLTRLGSGGDPRTGRRYAPNTMDQAAILAQFRGSGTMRKVINIPVLDSAREWRDWQADAPDIEKLEQEERRLAIRRKVMLADLNRGLGGGALILGLPGDPTQPARPGGVGSLAYVHAVTRWELTLGTEIIDALDPLFGQPAWYDLQSRGGSRVRVHPSRVIPFCGEPIPNMPGTSWEDRFWGESRVQTCGESCANLDDALANFAVLPSRVRTSILKIPGLSELCATPEGEAALATRARNFIASESQFGLTMLDAGSGEEPGEDLDHRQVTWAGIPEYITALAEALAAVADIPMTRLWGRTPEGMSSSGDSQQKDWNKMVKARQELDLRPQIERLDEFLIPSALGSAPDNVHWLWAPLDQPSQKEETERFKTFTDALEKLIATNTIPDRAMTKAVQNTVVENAWLPGLDGALAELPEDERFGLPDMGRLPDLEGGESAVAGDEEDDDAGAA